MHTAQCVMAVLATVAGSCLATEPYNANPPCSNTAFEVDGVLIPAMNSYFTYHFEGALRATESIEALGTIEACVDIVNRAEGPIKRRKSLAAYAEKAAEPYKAH